MPAPQRIKDLVENFRANFDHVQSNEYKEEDLRNHYLNPFFQELGWDMEDKAGKGPMRDLHYEKTIKSGAPDYGFYTDGKLRFFVEAKNPSKNVCNNPPAALQLRGYGWSAKTVRGILTDFEEFSIYDTTVRPKAADQARVARLDCIKYTEFVERWDEIYALFSREAVLGGSLEKLEKKRAKDAVDDGLLEDISSWRHLLATNIANRNKLSEERLNRIVQDTIARLLFLRICEDRGIAHEGDLREVAEGEGNYAKLYKLFKKAEQRYDSDLFEVASISDLVIDDKVLKEVVSEMYFPKSPYKFDAIPAEILGQVYEQFLGKVIRLTEGGHAKVEEKPEVRKAGGIYYTPSYIVEYIVRNTVGELVEGKTPKKIETLSIVDPACGSGSFLLGAYKFLVDWYRDWYVANDASKHQKEKKIYTDADKQWQLTLDERKRVLTAHIFGVDLDRQAVEMAKLSLMLEALRAPEQQSLFNDRMLPRMGDNIKCGNALIGTDYFAEKPKPEPGERGLINPFNWDGKEGFPEIFARGGFDAVIGNPPYIQLSMAEYFSQGVSDYFSERVEYSIGRMNTYGLFLKKGIELFVKKGGYLGFIMPNTFLTQESYQELRREILRLRIVSITDYKKLVFSGAVVEAITLILKKSQDKDNYIEIISYDNEAMKMTSHHLAQTLYETTNKNAFLTKVDRDALAMKKKIEHGNVPLGTLVNINQAIALKSDRAASLFKEKKAENYKRVIDGRNIGRYSLNWDGVFLAYDVKKIHSCKRTDIFEAKEKIMLRRVGDRIIATYDNKRYYALNTIVVITPKEDLGMSLKALLGILNSKLVNFYYVFYLKSTKKVFSEIQARQFAQIPVPSKKKIEEFNTTQIDGLVDQMMVLEKTRSSASAESETIALQRQIDATDGQIDELVYKLYGLTDEDVRIVEEGTK